MTCQSTAVIAVLCDELPRTDRDGLMPLNKPPETCLQNKKTPKPRNRTERLRENFNGKPSAAGSLDTNLTLQPQNLKRIPWTGRRGHKPKGTQAKRTSGWPGANVQTVATLFQDPSSLRLSMISAGISNSNLRKRGCKESRWQKKMSGLGLFLIPATDDERDMLNALEAIVGFVVVVVVAVVAVVAAVAVAVAVAAAAGAGAGAVAGVWS